MKLLNEEIFKRFPEVRTFVFNGDEEFPYLMMEHLADWVINEVKRSLTTDLVKRIVGFCNWCKSQPRGKTAKDDLLTIWTVGFFEKMFENEATHTLIPKIVTKQELIENRDYLITWVGQSEYNKALKRFE